ncbi:unnamed protein product, partial [Mesorhabditis belari]|uniref:Phosphotransferase n=1 Tax=Mesorhabditis belari TaxID=2138241 RepID=A0AAF3J8C6_9BILA
MVSGQEDRQASVSKRAPWDVIVSRPSRGIDLLVDVVAILNDTTATMVACAFKEEACQVGIIVGTGTNAFYMEKLSKCSKLEGDPEIDLNRIKFLKMSSGMYLGDLVRLILVRLARENLLFDGKTDGISEKGVFLTEYISEIEREFLEDDDQIFSKTFQILKSMGIDEVTKLDCVCTLVSTRAAHLIAAATAALLNRMGRQFVSIEIDGSVYRFHSTFSRLYDKKLSELIDMHLKYQLVLSIDGSG